MDTETYQLLRGSVRRFVEERLMPREDQVEADDAVPDDIVAEMRELGLFGLTIPEQYGGLGLNVQEEAGVVFELGRTSLAFRSVIGTTVGIGSQGIVIDGTERRWQSDGSLSAPVATGTFTLERAVVKGLDPDQPRHLTAVIHLDGSPETS